MKKTITTIATNTNNAAPEEKVTLSIAIPAALHRRIRLESMMFDRPVGTLIEEWIDQNVAPEGVVTANDMSERKNVPESNAPGVKLCGLSAPISKRHHSLLKLEAFRCNTSMRVLVGRWIEENTKPLPASPARSMPVAVPDPDRLAA